MEARSTDMSLWGLRSQHRVQYDDIASSLNTLPGLTLGASTGNGGYSL